MPLFLNDHLFQRDVIFLEHQLMQIHSYFIGFFHSFLLQSKEEEEINTFHSIDHLIRSEFNGKIERIFIEILILCSCLPSPEVMDIHAHIITTLEYCFVAEDREQKRKKIYEKNVLK